MVKKITTLNIEHDLIEEAKRKFINISSAAEEGIKNKLGMIDVKIIEPTKCEFCGREDRKATRNDLTGLTWLYPDEKWICEKCLKSRSHRITK